MSFLNTDPIKKVSSSEANLSVHLPTITRNPNTTKSSPPLHDNQGSASTLQNEMVNNEDNDYCLNLKDEKAYQHILNYVRVASCDCDEIVSMGSGCGNLESHLQKDIPDKPVICIDPQYKCFVNHAHKIFTMKPQFDSLIAYQKQNRESPPQDSKDLKDDTKKVKSICLLLNWTPPNDQCDYFDIKSVIALKPKSVVLLFEQYGAAGSTLLHRWVSKIYKPVSMKNPPFFQTLNTDIDNKQDQNLSILDPNNRLSNYRCVKHWFEVVPNSIMMVPDFIHQLVTSDDPLIAESGQMMEFFMRNKRQGLMLIKEGLQKAPITSPIASTLPIASPIASAIHCGMVQDLEANLPENEWDFSLKNYHPKNTDPFAKLQELFDFLKTFNLKN